MARPGDRRQRWNSSCSIGGSIMLLIGIFFISSNCVAGYIMGGIIILFGLLEFKDMKTGWKMSDKRPPWADEHDAIDRKWERTKNGK